MNHRSMDIRTALAVTTLASALALALPARAGDGSAPVCSSPVAAGEKGATACPAPSGFDAANDPDSGAPMLGRPAPSWTFDRWVRGGPLTLAGLRGKVVLLRFWTEDCRYCTHTLPYLESLRAAHAGDDFAVVCAFRPREGTGNVKDAHILDLAKKMKYAGPVAFDRRWSTLNRYWLDGHPERSWTSVSFLIDRDGIVRWVHGGGEYHHTDDVMHHRCDLEAQELERVLAQVLSEKKVSALR